MNLGQFLSAYSPLPSGTVAQHLAALQIGTGSGQTVFTSQLCVSIETPRVEVSRKARKPSVQQETSVPSVANSKDRKALYCAVSQNKLITQVSTDEMTVSVGSHRTLFVHRAEQAQYVKKGITQ